MAFGLTGVWWLLSDGWVVFLLGGRRSAYLLWLSVQFGCWRCNFVLLSALVGKVAPDRSVQWLVCGDSSGRYEVAKMALRWGYDGGGLWWRSFGVDLRFRQGRWQRWRFSVWLGCWFFLLLCFALWKSVQTGMAVGESKGVDFNPASGAFGKLAAAAVGQRGRGNNGFFLLFSMVWYFGPLFLVGLISPYSLELGLGFKVVSCLWRFSWGLIVSILVCCGGQFADKRSLHVVWFVWSMVFEWDGCHSGNWYAVLSRLSGISLVACGRKIRLGVGPCRFMDVIIVSDGPVTIVLDWFVCSGTWGHIAL